MADRLRVTELDFDTIKTNLKTFLKQQSEFTDYDFDGAGLSVLLDILAYNTHYNAYYLNMIANEAFLDTALLRDSVVSHAKTLGYIPYSITAPRAVINFQVNSSSSTPSTLTLPKGYKFLSNQIDGKVYTFVVLEDTTVTKSNSSFFFENLEIYEGQLITYKFLHDQGSNPKQIFIIPEQNIDTTTLKVSVSPSSSSTVLSPYTKVQDVLDVNSESQVYFLQETRNNRYEIYFGNGIVGKKLADGSAIYANYLVTNGSGANKANNFIGSASLNDSLSESLTNFIISPVSSAAGGSDRESVDSIKFGAASQYATQNRLVTRKDYESFIKRNYPSVDSVSVWGGEDNDPRVYGKVFISLKPKKDYYISDAEKERINKDILSTKNIVSISSEIVDPDYIYLIIEAEILYDQTRTLSTEEYLKQSIRNAILNYRNVYLDKFNSKVIDSKLEYAIDSVDTSAILGNELSVRVQKRFKPILNVRKSYIIDFNVPLHRGTTTNKLKSTEFTVLDSTGTERNVIFEEIPQSYTGISSIEVINPGFGYTEVPTVTITGDGYGAEAKAVIVNGKIQSIQIINRGVDYTKASISITGIGQNGLASIILDNKVGTLRTIYYDTNAERKIVNENIGTINYSTGRITLNDINFLSITSPDDRIRIDIETDSGIIESVRNSIITIDEQDPKSIQLQLKQA